MNRWHEIVVDSCKLFKTVYSFTKTTILSILLHYICWQNQIKNRKQMDTSIFGKDITKEDRNKSYDYIENFIFNNVKDWTKAPQTDILEDIFSKEIRELDKADFAFLVCHSGYIPEFYEHDSSQETLYSKLIEALVCEWAKIFGFTESVLQKQKANKEDVTIKKGEKVIVCDAKSFRLGRSQAAPNVKDTIKKAAYVSWLNQYHADNRVGGLVTFPSLHDWQKGSEAYKYFTDGDPAIMMLFYEEMTFMLLNEYTAEDIMSFMENYKVIYPNCSDQKCVYEKGLYQNLFEKNKEAYHGFITLYKSIVKEKVSHTITQIDTHLENTKITIEEDIEKMNPETVKQIAIDSSFDRSCGQLLKQRINIFKFRPFNKD